MKLIQVKKERIQRIQQMLLEMAGGNFFYRLERLGNNDIIEGVEMALNMLSEEIQESLPYESFVNSNGIGRTLVEMCFLLDVNGLVQTTNEKTSRLMFIQHEDIVGKSFESFLSEDSKIKWQVVWKSLLQTDLYATNLDLVFSMNNELLIPKNCHITSLKGSPEMEKTILVTVVLHTKVQLELEKELKKRIIQFQDRQYQTNKNPKTLVKQKTILSINDVDKVKQAYNIIINNPAKDFPNLKDFALQIGTNEFKLKFGFKKLYGTSVHQFLISERLRKSILLVQYSELSLKRIANLTGFKSYPHFCRTFKKRFEFTPSTLRKRTLEDRKSDIPHLIPLENDISNKDE
ncbi:helix-turn-helix transcriptional regulator [Flavivirga jejuensis]|uniref:AraC family transcriptional regulator n=1 Tax=Flavivirga jejuensis TaxID=870487 RepID=A0ABT8WVD9_9FLAO|nr:AraC family transcriptional regulator [Flavivirga jejuensis]MDO5977115.1 AraC family transcriptional regulator [Flavivirga jejuensis]